MTQVFDFTPLIEQGLVRSKQEGDLTLYKYDRKVFYNNLWHRSPLLLEARGIVLNSQGEAVIWPFTKVFNHKENGTDCSPTHPVVAVRKVNGFMAAARWYNNELLVTTTGSFDSDFVALARKHLEKIDPVFFRARRDYTCIFEICDESDPHIVTEQEGSYLIGMRNMITGRMTDEACLDMSASRWGILRPISFSTTFDNVLEGVQQTTHEGWMIRDEATGETLMKIKSPHYLTKKFLMRMGAGKVETMFTNPELYRQSLDEEFYDVYDHILALGKEHWTALNDQQRRAIIEEFFID